MWIYLEIDFTEYECNQARATRLKSIKQRFWALLTSTRWLVPKISTFIFWVGFSYQMSYVQVLCELSLMWSSMVRSHSTQQILEFELIGYSCPFVSWCFVSLCLSISEWVLKVLPQTGQGIWLGSTPLTGISWDDGSPNVWGWWGFLPLITYT
jgi:hypothetical protein